MATRVLAVRWRYNNTHTLHTHIYTRPAYRRHVFMVTITILQVTGIFVCSGSVSLSTVAGCQDSGSGTFGCPTAGGVTVTMTGNDVYSGVVGDLTSQMQVLYMLLIGRL